MSLTAASTVNEAIDEYKLEVVQEIVLERG